MRRKAVLTITQSAFLLLFLLLSLGINATQSRHVKTPADKRAALEPASENMVSMLLLPDNRSPIHVVQAEGALVRLESDDGMAYGFAARIVSKRGVHVQVTMYRIGQVRQGDDVTGETLLEVGHFDLQKGAPIATRADGLQVPLALRLLDVNKGKRPANPMHPDDGGIGGIGFGQCCVNCDGLQTCACMVEADCAWCCSDACC
jgi:hypothetical protein